MRFILIFILFFTNLAIAHAQFIDSFNDGDFTQNPSWESNSGDFTIDKLELRSSKTGAASFGISTELGSSISIWNFSVRLGFNPSSANYVHVFLSSDSIVENANNGYYVKIGNTNDEISLYELSNGTSTEIISGTDDALDKSSSSFDVSVQYKNDSWFLFTKESGSVSFNKEGESLDASVSLGKYFGVFIKQSTSNAGKHYLDNFYVGKPPVDVTPPFIFNASLNSPNSMDIFLNEDIKTISLSQLLVNGISPQNISSAFPNKKITAVWASVFPKNQNLSIELRNIEDLSGNSNSSSTFNLFNAQYDSAVYGDIIISEIMPVPSPSIGTIPAVEYVEIYNRSANYINLANYTFSDASNTVTLPDSSIAPYSYAILSKNSDDLSSFGRWIPLSSLPSLNNDGDELSFKSNTGFLVHSVNYKSDWHLNSIKSTGGWSLELIDTNKFCLGSQNWSSNISIGGTPGIKNSIQGEIDITENFTITNSFVDASNNIHVIFSENIGPCSACSAELKSAGISLNITSINANELILNSSFTLLPDIVHSLELKGFISCDGRELKSIIIKLGAKTTLRPEAWDLIINEVLFNPKGYDDDYVEIYNRSNKIIDLQEIFIANANDDGSIKDSYLISNQPLTILPNSYLALTTSKNNTTKTYRPIESANIQEIGKMPTYSNSEGTVILVSRFNTILHSFEYDDDMHFELLSNDEGVSLERTHIDTSSENWASASYKFNYGTPGYINSQFRSISNNSNFASLVSKTISPDGDGWEDKLLIKINNENNPSVVSLTIYNEFGQLLSKVKSQQLVGVSGLIEWDGLASGRAAPMGNYIAFVQSIASDGSIIKAKLVFTVLKKQ